MSRKAPLSKHKAWIFLKLRPSWELYGLQGHTVMDTAQREGSKRQPELELKRPPQLKQYLGDRKRTFVGEGSSGYLGDPIWFRLEP